MPFEVKNNSLCQMDLCKDLGATEKDMNMISSMLENMFNILIEDEEIERIGSVDDIVQMVGTKRKKGVNDLVLVNN
jgi:hypothetical protein